jgi:hypothetical protein
LLFAMLLTAGQTAPTGSNLEPFEAQKTELFEIIEKYPCELAHFNSLKPPCLKGSYRDCYLNRDQAGYYCCLVMAMKPEIRELYLNLSEEDPVKKRMRTLLCACDFLFFNDYPEIFQHPEELDFYASLPNVPTGLECVEQLEAEATLEPLARSVYKRFFISETKEGRNTYDLYLSLPQDHPQKKAILEQAKEYAVAHYNELFPILGVVKTDRFYSRNSSS